MIKTEIRKGSNVSKHFKRNWNRIIYKAFKSPALEDFSKDIFFLLRDGKKIMAVGALTPVKIKYNNKDYNILGITEIISLVKKKGYGKILMKSILDYLKKKGKTGVGFCARKTSPFYIKSGLKVKKDIIKRFLYNPKNKEEEKEVKDILKQGRDILYVEGKDNFMKEIISNKSSVQLPCMYW